jgi:hypothetical protein
MAEIINVAGACLVKVGTNAGALETLGYTRDGAQITFEPYKVGVKTDDNGGENGPDTDVQYMGETARIRLEMTKWDEAIADKLRVRLLGGTVGTVGAPGTLLIAGSKFTRLCLITTTRPLNFPICMFLEPHEINKGTKYSTWVQEAIAYKNLSDGVLFNSTTT